MSAHTSKLRFNLAFYRMRGSFCSASLGEDGRVHFWGNSGTHSGAADDLKRGHAHWIGFCSANRGKKASPKHITAAAISNAAAKIK